MKISSVNFSCRHFSAFRTSLRISGNNCQHKTESAVGKDRSKSPGFIEHLMGKTEDVVVNNAEPGSPNINITWHGS